MAFADGPLPRAFAHRGWHVGDLAGCENSHAAFARAVQEGYRYLETDVHLTADGVLVAFHDDVLDRVTDATGPLAVHRWADLQRVRIGGREPIPVMADLLEDLPTAHFTIDAKTDAALGPLMDLIRDADATDRVCVGAFSTRRVRTARAVGGPRLATSLGPREVAANVTAAALGLPALNHGAVAAQVPPQYGPLPVIRPQFITAAHRAGLEVHAWTINDPAEMRRLLGSGVDGIMTDAPDTLRSVLADRGQWRDAAANPAAVS